MPSFGSRRRLLSLMSGAAFGVLTPGVTAAAASSADRSAETLTTSSTPIAVSVAAGVAVSAKSTSTTPGDHVAVLNLAADGGINNAALNVVSRNTAFSAAEVSGRETGHGTLKITHVNPGPTSTSDANAAAISVCRPVTPAGRPPRGYS